MDSLEPYNEEDDTDESSDSSLEDENSETEDGKNGHDTKQDKLSANEG